MRTPKLLIADDHTLIADLCQRLLEPEFDIVGIVNDGRKLVHAAVEFRPDLIVADIAMPVLNGLDAGRQIKELLPAVKLVYLTMNNDPEVAAEALECGASGYLLKTCASSELVHAVHCVLAGRTYVCKALSQDTLEYLRCRYKQLVEDRDKLTARQREVLQLLAEGRLMKEIGDILNMSTRTVAFHKYRMMDILDAKNNADLVRYAVRTHLVA